MEHMPFGVFLEYWSDEPGSSHGWHQDYVGLAGDDASAKLVLAIDRIKRLGASIRDIYIVQERISGLGTDVAEHRTPAALRRHFPNFIVSMLMKPSASSPRR